MHTDVTTLEVSRSAMALLDGLAGLSCSNEIGPRVFESCSPKVPSRQAIQRLLERACDVIPSQRLWSNPGDGTTTRGREETEEALLDMVEAARALRCKLSPLRATVDC